MKKLSKVTLIVAIVVIISVFTLALTACGKSGSDGESINIADDYDYSMIESKLNELKTNGIFVKLKVSSNDSEDGSSVDYYAYGAKGDVYYYSYGDEDDQTYVDVSNNDYIVAYTASKENGTLVWSKDITYYSEYAGALTKDQVKQSLLASGSGVWGWLGYYANTTTGNGTKTTDTFLGRSCDKYVFTDGVVTFVGSVGLNYECWIDKATGVCLKYTASYSAITTEGSGSASVTIECTEFNTNWPATLPTVDAAHTNTHGNANSQGGEGRVNPNGGNGEGGTQGNGGNGSQSQQGGSGEGNNSGSGEDGGSGEAAQNSPFVGKRLTVSSVSIEDNHALESLFEGGYIQLYSDLNFEFIKDSGCFIGHYLCVTGSTYNRAYLNTMKIYKDGKYDYNNAESMEELEIVYNNGAYTLSFGMEINDQYYSIVIELEDDGNVQAHDNDVCPLDPNGYGIDTQYQVTQETWDGIFNGDLLFENIGNFTVEYAIDSQVDVYDTNGSFKMDYYYINESDTVFYYQQSSIPDENGQCSYLVYYSDGHGHWGSGTPADYDYDFFDTYTGTIPAQFIKSVYNSIGHYYSISSFSYFPKGSSEKRQISNFKVWFEQNLLKRIEYTCLGDTFTYEYSDFDDTEVELPNQ